MKYVNVDISKSHSKAKQHGADEPFEVGLETFDVKSHI